jgi:hypothetical protein
MNTEIEQATEEIPWYKKLGTGTRIGPKVYKPKTALRRACKLIQKVRTHEWKVSHFRVERDRQGNEIAASIKIWRNDEDGKDRFVLLRSQLPDSRKVEVTGIGVIGWVTEDIKPILKRKKIELIVRFSPAPVKKGKHASTR